MYIQFNTYTIYICILININILINNYMQLIYIEFQYIIDIFFTNVFYYSFT